jgi:hypothetical protein
VWALFLERATYAMSQVHAENGWFWVSFAYPDEALMAEIRKSPKGWAIVSPTALAPDAYAYYSAVTAIWRENRVYDECNKLVLSPDASVQDPARAQACAATMAVIEARRRQRSEEAYRREQFAEGERNRQFMMQLQQQQQEFTANENRKAARRAALQSYIQNNQVRPVSNPFATFPKTSHTTCRQVGATTYCDTQ